MRRHKSSRMIPVLMEALIAIGIDCVLTRGVYQPMNVIPYKREVLILVATTCVNRFDVVAVYLVCAQERSPCD